MAAEDRGKGVSNDVSRRPLHAELLRADERVIRARELLREAFADRRRWIASVREPDPDRRTSYEQALRELGRLRGGALFHPYLGSGFGHGPFVELADGSVKYDMITGIGVHALGHAHPAIVDSAFEAMLGGTVMQGNLQQNVESLALCETLTALARSSGAPLAHCFLTTSGAMANENALKLVFHHRSPADRILAFEGAFAGRTIALAQITDRPSYRAGLPQALEVDYVPYFEPHDPQGSSLRAREALDSHLARHRGGHAAMIFELVLGEGGFQPGTAEFFVPLMERVKGADVAVLVDEIQTFGRTTRPFAFQHFGLDRCVDLATVGKMSQVCATLFRDAYVPPPGLISQTFTGATAAILAARATIEGLESAGCFGPDGRNARVHAHFVERLEAIAARHPDLVRGPYGLGAMIAFTALDGRAETTKAVLADLFEEGVVAFSAGEDPMRIRFLPPVAVLEAADVDAVCAILEHVLVRAAKRSTSEVAP